MAILAHPRAACTWTVYKAASTIMADKTPGFPYPVWLTMALALWCMCFRRRWSVQFGRGWHVWFQVGRWQRMAVCFGRGNVTLLRALKARRWQRGFDY